MIFDLLIKDLLRLVPSSSTSSSSMVLPFLESLSIAGLQEVHFLVVLSFLKLIPNPLVVLQVTDDGFVPLIQYHGSRLRSLNIHG